MNRLLVPALLCSLAVALPQSPQAAPGPVLTDPVPLEEVEGVTTEYAIGTAVVGGLNVASILKNTAGNGPRSRAWGCAGVVGGVLGMGLGVANLVGDRSGAAKDFGSLNLGLGVVAAICGVVALKHTKDTARPPEPAVIGDLPVRFGGGVTPYGLVVQVTF